MRTLALLLLFAGPWDSTVKAQVQNPGFESGLSGWTAPCPCAPIQFTGNVPPGGGLSAIEVGILDLNCFCSLMETVHQPVPWVVPGQWVLSAWIRNADPGNTPGAAVRVSEGSAFGSPILADVWSDDGAWTYVADTFLIGSGTLIDSLRVSLIPDDGNQMPAGLFAAFDQVQLQPLISNAVENRDPEELKAFPVPVSDLLTISPPEACTSLLVLDATGRVVRQVIPAQPSGPTRIAVQDLPPGHYVAQVISDAGIRTVRFIKN